MFSKPKSKILEISLSDLPLLLQEKKLSQYSALTIRFGEFNESSVLTVINALKSLKPYLDISVGTNQNKEYFCHVKQLEETNAPNIKIKLFGINISKQNLHLIKDAVEKNSSLTEIDFIASNGGSNKSLKLINHIHLLCKKNKILQELKYCSLKNSF